MLNKTQYPSIFYRFILVLVIGIVGTLVAFAEEEATKPEIKIPPRRQSETEATYQRRVNMAQRANEARLRILPQIPKLQMLNKQSGETDTTYQLRLQLTIKGLLDEQYPNPIPKRENETEAAYQARAGSALRASEMLRNSLIARPGETDAAYFARLTANKETNFSTSLNRPGESMAALLPINKSGARLQLNDGIGKIVFPVSYVDSVRQVAEQLCLDLGCDSCNFGGIRGHGMPNIVHVRGFVPKRGPDHLFCQFTIKYNDAAAELTVEQLDTSYPPQFSVLPPKFDKEQLLKELAKRLGITIGV
jgi:hypothetical protein